MGNLAPALFSNVNYELITIFILREVAFFATRIETQYEKTEKRRDRAQLRYGMKMLMLIILPN